MIVQLTDVAVQVLCFAALTALAFAPLEHLWPAQARGDRRGLRCGLVVDVAFATLGQVIARGVLALGLGFVLVSLREVGLERPLFAFVADHRARVSLELATGLLLFELGGYAYHRLAHALPCLWRLHALHHSSAQLDWLASFRQHPLELVLMTVVQNAPLVLLDVPLATHASVLLLLKLHTVFVHANIALPDAAWTRVIAAPRFHHRHHQRAGVARNYASLFPFIDRLFGTYTDAAQDAQR